MGGRSDQLLDTRMSMGGGGVHVGREWADEITIVKVRKKLFYHYS